MTITPQNTVWLILTAVILGVLAGCDERDKPVRVAASSDDAPALDYTLTSTRSAYAQAFVDASSGPWRNRLPHVEDDTRVAPDMNAVLSAGDMSVFAPEAFPGWIVHSKRKELAFFKELPSFWRIGAPTRLALPHHGGVEVYNAGEDIPSGDVESMDRAWVLVWFSGARGWDRFDVPVLLVLQHQPQSIVFDEGVHFQFADRAGSVVFFPLYGFYKPPQNNDASLRWTNMPSRSPLRHGPFGERLNGRTILNVRPYDWITTLPAHIVARCDAYAAYARMIPVYLRDQYQVDLAKDTLRLRYDITWYEITDDWNTPKRKLAPISPTIALAKRYGFPVELSGVLHDPLYPTTLGPWTGIPDVDHYDVALPVLRFLAETRVLDWNENSSLPVIEQSVDFFTEKAPRMLLNGEPYGPTHGMFPPRDTKGPNFAWAAISYHRAMAYGMAAMQGSDLQRAQRSIRNLLDHSYFTSDGYGQEEIGGQSFHYTTDISLDRSASGDAGKVQGGLVGTAWLFSFYGRMYDWIDRNREDIERSVPLLAMMSWSRAGRAGSALPGDELVPTFSYARLMYAARDQKRFAWGTYAAVMSMLQTFVRYGPVASYARQFEPWQRFDSIHPSEVATDVRAPGWGWGLGGPGNEPVGQSSREPIGDDEFSRTDRLGEPGWHDQWLRLDDLDVTRFLRDLVAGLENGLGLQFHLWQQREFPEIADNRSYPLEGGVLAMFNNPAFLASLRYEILGEPLAELRVRLNGWLPRPQDLGTATWSDIPTPRLWWALGEQRYERILGDDVLPWTPGLGQRYERINNGMLFHTFSWYREKEDMNGSALPFPAIGWFRAGYMAHSADWPLGFITADLRHRIAERTAHDRYVVFTYGEEQRPPPPLEIPLEGDMWRFRLDPHVQGIDERWFSVPYDDSDWASIQVPGAWEDQGWSGSAMPDGKLSKAFTVNQPPNYQAAYDGTAWYRVRAFIPEDARGLPLFFEAGRIDDFDITYMNGVAIGQTDAASVEEWWDARRYYAIPETLIRYGEENVIAVMIGDNNHLGGILRSPVRLVAVREHAVSGEE